MRVKRILESLSARAPGPQPTFQSFQLLDALLTIRKDAPIGRKKLSEQLGLGEGVVRTILQRLRSGSLILVAGRGGCVLSEKGEALVSELEEKLKDIGSIKLRLPWSCRENYALIVKGAAHLVRRGLEQRDEAIRAGAKALMVLTCTDGRIMMPGVSNLTSEKPDFALQLMRELEPEDGDVILIAGGDHLVEARWGALAAAQTLL